MIDLQIDQLELKAPDRTLVHGLSARLLSGEFWCVLGRNGAGKSTLLRALAGFRIPSSGRVTFNQREVEDFSLAELARLRAYLPQQISDAFSATVRDTVMTARYPYHSGLALRLGFENSADETACDAALELFDLLAYAQRDVLSLSGGERRKVSLATAFAQSTALLLLDEPSAHLDLDVEDRVFSLLKREVAAGKCIVASTHNPNLALRYATHVVLLYPGGQVQAGSIEELLTAPELSAVYAHPIEALKQQDRRWFLPL